MSALDERRAAERRGRRAEALAALRLRAGGWRILEHRARTPAGEIDLVAVRGDILAFVEVKERARLRDAAYALSDHQRRRLLRAGAFWRARHGRFDAHEVRFDLILVAPWRWPRWIPAAFTAEGVDGLNLL